MKLKNWALVRSSPIYRRVNEKWAELLSCPGNCENQVQSYLDDHTGFFFPRGCGIECRLVIAKLRLGSEHVTDIVVASCERSYGIRYTLIELESPGTPPFNQDGTPSRRLNSALKQVADWKDWIAKSREAAKRIFPSKEFCRFDIPNFAYRIIIGRRTDPHLNLRSRIQDGSNVEIRSFDYLTEELAKNTFSPFSWISRDLVPSPSATQNNQYANPFYKAFSDPEWNQVVKDGRFDISHIIANNLELIMEKTRWNEELLEELDSHLEKLPAADREIPQRFHEYVDLT